MSKATSCSAESSVSRHCRKGSTTSKAKGPSVISMRSVGQLVCARTVVWCPRTLTMAYASAVPRLG